MTDFHIEMGKSVGLMASLRERALTVFEKKFLLCAERGDIVSVRKFLETHTNTETSKFNINCMDPLGRTALVLAIENENMGLIDLLLKHGIQSGDSLLHAISEEYVEAVETLLQHEEAIQKSGEPYSWELIDHKNSVYTKDITPLILAAHKNNYEILKLLLDRGAAIPLPHDARCGCETCVTAASEDHLRHSRSRINAYRALCSPSLISLSSRDPILTAFQLSWELSRLSNIEKEFAIEYRELKKQVQTFAVALLDHVRTNQELRIILNYDPEAESPDEELRLERVKLAIDYRQKRFVAHPNVQQLLGSVWFQGMPGFRRRGPVGQAFEVLSIAVRFPLLALCNLLLPNTRAGKKARKPFVKFITNSASYLFFLKSQRVESLIVEQLGPELTPSWLWKIHSTGRGKPPTLTEWAIIMYVIGFIWQETVSLWGGGLLKYSKDLWNLVDFLTNCFYINWLGLRLISWYQVYVLEDNLMSHGLTEPKLREDWDPYDPLLISEGMFGAATIFSFLKLVHIFSVHPHLGPLQISLGRMVFDILKFFFIYTWVVFAFGCGMNNLLWYYALKDKERCVHGNTLGIPALDQDHSCNIWRRFSNLFETSQTLFWASFGLVDLVNFEMTGIKEFTRFWGLLMFGSYSIINVVVLLNLLIAMMSDSFQVISACRDTEWKFARSKLWIEYFEDYAGVPPPFNLIPSLRRFNCCKWKKLKHAGSFSGSDAGKNFNQTIYERVMRCLVRRYVIKEQRIAEQTGLVTEDDINEMKHDLASFKYELFDLLRVNGMKTADKVKNQQNEATGRKERIRERRLLRGFSIGLVEKTKGVLEAFVGAHVQAARGSDDEESGAIFPRRLSLKNKTAAMSRWTAAVNALAKTNGNQIGTGTDTPAQNVSLADLRETVMQEEELEALRTVRVANGPPEERGIQGGLEKSSTSLLKETLPRRDSFPKATSRKGGKSSAHMKRRVTVQQQPSVAEEQLLEREQSMESKADNVDGSKVVCNEKPTQIDSSTVFEAVEVTEKSSSKEKTAVAAEEPPLNTPEPAVEPSPVIEFMDSMASSHELLQTVHNIEQFGHGSDPLVAVSSLQPEAIEENAEVQVSSEVSVAMSPEKRLGTTKTLGSWF